MCSISAHAQTLNDAKNTFKYQNNERIFVVALVCTVSVCVSVYRCMSVYLSNSVCLYVYVFVCVYAFVVIIRILLLLLLLLLLLFIIQCSAHTGWHWLALVGNNHLSDELATS